MPFFSSHASCWCQERQWRPCYQRTVAVCSTQEPVFVYANSELSQGWSSFLDSVWKPLKACTLPTDTWSQGQGVGQAAHIPKPERMKLGEKIQWRKKALDSSMYTKQSRRPHTCPGLDARSEKTWKKSSTSTTGWLLGSVQGESKG